MAKKRGKKTDFEGSGKEDRKSKDRRKDFKPRRGESIYFDEMDLWDDVAEEQQYMDFEEYT